MHAATCECIQLATWQRAAYTVVHEIEQVELLSKEIGEMHAANQYSMKDLYVVACDLHQGRPQASEDLKQIVRVVLTQAAGGFALAVICWLIVICMFELSYEGFVVSKGANSTELRSDAVVIPYNLCKYLDGFTGIENWGTRGRCSASVGRSYQSFLYRLLGWNASWDGVAVPVPDWFWIRREQAVLLPNILRELSLYLAVPAYYRILFQKQFAWAPNVVPFVLVICWRLILVIAIFRFDVPAEYHVMRMDYLLGLVPCQIALNVMLVARKLGLLSWGQRRNVMRLGLETSLPLVVLGLLFGYKRSKP